MYNVKIFNSEGKKTSQTKTGVSSQIKIGGGWRNAFNVLLGRYKKKYIYFK